MSKKYIIPVVLVGVCLLTISVFAYTLLKTFNITFEIKSPQDYLSIKYLILNDNARCDTYSSNDYITFDNSIKNLGELEVGQYKQLCFLFESNSSNTVNVGHTLIGNWSTINIINDNLNVTLTPTDSWKKVGLYFVTNSTGVFNGSINFIK